MRKTIREDLFRFLIPGFLVYTSALAVSVWEFAMWHGGTFVLLPVSIVGALMVICGLTISLVAVGTLRRFYSSTLVIREGHRLIRHGIYKHTRHPIYLGTIIATMGMPLCLASLFGTLAMLVLIPLFLGRIRIEERMLIGEFGDEYRTYMETTRKLIPHIH